MLAGTKAALRALTLVLLGAAVWAPAASGATAELTFEEPIPGIEPDAAYVLTVRAEEGEANVLTVSGDAGGYTVTDLGQPLEAGPGCEAVSPAEVHCATGREARDRTVFVDAGGGADRVATGGFTPTARVELSGGSGADTLTGSDADELLRGGGGKDLLSGGAGDDTLDGGRGDDSLAGDEGLDVASYETRSRTVVVDLAAGTGGAAGERDGLQGIESAVGGTADDRLLGDSGPNDLKGGADDATARDRLQGRGGDDALSGYHVDGGSGDDSLDGVSVACGHGRDTVLRGQFRTRGPYAPSCERAIAYFFLVVELHPVASSDHFARLAFGCVPPRCKFRVELRDENGVFARRQVSGPTTGDGDETVRVFARLPFTRVPHRRTVTLRVIAERPFRDRIRLRL